MTSFRHSLGSTISLLWGLKVGLRQDRSQVLMYHSIGGRAEGDLRGLYSVEPSAFRNQVNILRDRLSAGETSIVPFGSDESKAISITFDDGYLDNLTVAAPILAEYGLPFHVFLCPTFIESGRSDFLSRTDVLELATIRGVSLGVHGFSHKPLTSLDINDARSEMSSSRNWLEDLIQRPVTSMSYPHGAVNSQLAESALEAGFTHAACSKFGPIDSGVNPLTIPRIDIWSSDNKSSFTAKIDGKWDWMKWRT